MIYSGKKEDGSTEEDTFSKRRKKTIFRTPLTLTEQHRIVAKVDQLMALCDTLAVRLSKFQAKAEKLTSAAVQTLLAA